MVLIKEELDSIARERVDKILKEWMENKGRRT
jgi:hypothetical protein